MRKVFFRFRQNALFLICALLFSSIPNFTLATTGIFPIVVRSGGYNTTIPTLPKRIVSLSPSATEILFAIGAGIQVIAVDNLSNFPSEAPKSKLSAFSPSVEAIAAQKPDLVILSVDSTNSTSVRKSLEQLKIPVLMEKAPNKVSDAYLEYTAIGKATGHEFGAQTLIKRMRDSIRLILAKTKLTKPYSFFHELDNTLYSATTDTFIGSVYADFHLLNIADKASKADDAGYPQLSQEYVVASNPALIFLSDAQYGENLATVSNRPGWSTITAVKKARVFALPEDIPSRWGPRIVDFYQVIANAIAKIS